LAKLACGRFANPGIGADTSRAKSVVFARVHIRRAAGFLDPTAECESAVREE